MAYSDHFHVIGVVQLFFGADFLRLPTLRRVFVRHWGSIDPEPESFAAVFRRLPGYDFEWLEG
jgi:hypothetical protein